MERKKRKWWPWLLLVAAIVVLSLGVGRRLFNGGAQAAEPEPGQIVEAFVGDLSAMASASGKLLPKHEATLALGISGRVQEVYVELGDEVMAGDLLVQLETNALERAVRSAEQALAIQEANLAELFKGASVEDIAAAEAVVASAQAQLEALLEGPSEEELAAAEANLRAAEASVWGAAEQRDQVAAGATQAEIASAEAQLLQMQFQYDQAQEAHEATMRCFTDPTGKEHCPGLGPMEEQARQNLEIATKNLESAQAALDRLRAGADPNALGSANANVSAAAAQRDASQAQLDLLQVEASEAQLAGAEASLAQAQASLAALLKGASDERVQIAEAQVEQARIQLEEARDNLTKASLTAPFNGVVTAVHVAEGEFASGPAVELMDKNSLEVVLDVDEVDIGAISVGQAAVIELETWPDEELTGEVHTIAPNASAMQEIVTYEVRIAFNAGDLPIRAGMTANAEMVTAERQDVLLVPNRAIRADRENGTYTVNLYQADGSVEQAEVSIGLRDSRYTEILAGLEAGNRLMIGEMDDVLDFTQGPPEGVRNMRQ